MEDTNSEFAAWEVLRGGNPAALRGTPLVAQLLERWTLPYLASLCSKAFALILFRCVRRLGATSCPPTRVDTLTSRVRTLSVRL